ncbi:hypothetical protein PV350_11050 [Streptomyces sp. PA03-6a]|nr:hypothetical protein [Streptomyces sp. PA03-6a]
MDPDLYPDLIAAGGLSAALEQAAVGLGADLTIVRDGGGVVLQRVPPPRCPTAIR